MDRSKPEDIEYTRTPLWQRIMAHPLGNILWALMALVVALAFVVGLPGVLLMSVGVSLRGGFEVDPSRRELAWGVVAGWVIVATVATFLWATS